MNLAKCSANSIETLLYASNTILEVSNVSQRIPRIQLGLQCSALPCKGSVIFSVVFVLFVALWALCY